MNIEVLQNNDLQSYKDLIDSCFGGSQEVAHYQQSYDANSKDYTIMVAKDKGRVVGSITYYRIDLFTFSFQPSLEIFNVCVLPEYRGQKIAKMIFEQIKEYARANGYKQIFLTCLDSATDAHRLYESLGFQQTSSVKFILDLNKSDL